MHNATLALRWTPSHCLALLCDCTSDFFANIDDCIMNLSGKSLPLVDDAFFRMPCSDSITPKLIIESMVIFTAV